MDETIPNAADDRPQLPASRAFLRVTPPDEDPEETREWLDAFEQTIAREGPERATFLLRRLFDLARAKRVPLPPVLNTPYRNSIPLEAQPQYPGDLDIENRLSAIIRWNALAMVVRANRAHPELGGHIASYASAADLFEVGFNHFFRGGQDGDLVYFQPHSSTGVYSRAFLEGRLTEAHLEAFRRETAGGLPSYPHPRALPDFWEFPTVSMGLGPLNAIYQARFNRYLHDRRIDDTVRRLELTPGQSTVAPVRFVGRQLPNQVIVGERRASDHQQLDFARALDDAQHA